MVEMKISRWKIRPPGQALAFDFREFRNNQTPESYLNWENGGSYMIGMKPVGPHQTIEIDIKKLRDDQTPDEAGLIIPPDATQGQLKWSIKQTGPPPAGEETRQSLALIGRTDQVDLENGIISNYACQNWCESSYYSSYVTPANAEVEVGEQITYRAYQQDMDHYGDLTEFYQRITILHGTTTWISGYTSIATMNNSIATATGAGTTTIYATWQDYNAPVGTICDPLSAETEGDQIENRSPQPNAGVPPCDACANYVIYPSPSTVLSVKPPTVTITKADGSALPNPYRLGVSGGGHDRTQTLKATVSPPNQTTNVAIQVSSKITGSITNVNPTTGVITFTVVGNSESASGSSCSTGDSFIKAVLSNTTPVNKPVFVSVPSKIATPHDITGTLVIANRVLDATTSPAAQDLAANEVSLSTIFVRFLTITVKDQCNDLIGDIYAGATVTETVGSSNVSINQPLTSSSTYSDPTGASIVRNVVLRGSPQAVAWPNEPLTPMVGGTQTQNVAIQVDGFILVPAITNRTWTLTPPNTVTITWP